MKLWKIAVAVTAPIWGFFVMIVGAATVIFSGAAASEANAITAAGTCVPTLTGKTRFWGEVTPPNAPIFELTDIQSPNAAMIVGAAKRQGLPDRAAQMGIMAALQESMLTVLANDGSMPAPEGYSEEQRVVWAQQMDAVKASMSHPNKQGVGSNYDSLGLFQQRLSTGWGTLDELMDPFVSAARFYEALVKVEGWDTRPLTDVIADVQRPAAQFRGEYQKWQDAAGKIVTVAGDGCKPDEVGEVGDAPVFNGLAQPLVGKLTSPFGVDRGSYNHMGQDIARPRGSEIHAAANGKVTRASCAGFQGRSPCNLIIHHDGFDTWYVHMDDEQQILVNVGDEVRAGQPVARVGCRGNCSGPHLHFEVHIAGRPVDPVKFYRDHGLELGKE